MSAGPKQLCMLLLLSLSAHVYASVPDMTFEHLSGHQGLLGNEVHCILQDSRGYMWFGTEKGLNRYDGYGFTVYKHEPGNPSSIVDALIQSLWEDKQGTIWVGTWRGLERFNRASGTFSHFLPDPQGYVDDPANVIYSMREDRNGTLWLGTLNGLDTLDRVTGKFTYFRHDSSDLGSLGAPGVNGVFEDKAGALWLATQGGLDRYNPGSKSFTHYWQIDRPPRADDPVAFTSNHWIQTIHEARNGILWLCTNGGPVSFDRKKGSFRPYILYPGLPDSSTNRSVSSILEDDSGTLWIGTWGGGLMQYDARADSFVSSPLDPKLLPSNGICALDADRSGVMWIGTMGDGVLKVVQASKRFTGFVRDDAEFPRAINHIPPVTRSVQNNDVRFIYQESSGIISIGTATGIDGFDRKTGTFAHWASWDWPYAITGFLHSRFGSFTWTGIGGDGFNKIQDKPYRRKYFSTQQLGLGGSACSFYEDRRGILWMLISNAGICQFDPRTEQFKNLGIGKSQPFVAARMIIEDSIDNTLSGWGLWIGTSDGLWKYDARMDAFTRFGKDPKDPRSLSSNIVTTVFLDKRGTLWIGTDHGLNRMDTLSRTFESFTVDNGLPENNVLGILEDAHGRLWVSTPKAISKLDAETKRFTSYGVSDILPTNHFGAGCCLRSTTGEMYFGGNGGFFLFHPDIIEYNQYVPPIVITGFKKFDKPVALDSAISEKKAIVLSHTDNIFSFEFAALNFTKPELNQYAFKLEGYDTSWNYCGNLQYAQYINVEPGKYTFRAKGSNNDGVWNEGGASIAVIITPPWWKTTWFTILLWVTFAGSIGGTVRYVEVRKLKKRIELLERERALERERTRISQDMHDEVGSSLSEIAILSELAKKKPGEANIHVQEISERAAEVIDSVSEIVWAMNPKNDTLDNIVAHIRRHAIKYLSLAGISCKFVAPETVPSSPLPAEVRRNLFLVVKEALHNIVKHARAAEVSITVKCHQNSVEILIADNGRGFVIDERRGVGNGLNNMSKRIADIGGDLSTTSELGSGTSICLALKLAQPNDSL